MEKEIFEDGFFDTGMDLENLDVEAEEVPMENNYSNDKKVSAWSSEDEAKDEWSEGSESIGAEKSEPTTLELHARIEPTVLTELGINEQDFDGSRGKVYPKYESWNQEMKQNNGFGPRQERK